ncbi:MAG: hypothetical protein IJ846_02885 [Alphaproteobacteria bacterium]|nr:hypothetical protein [Alphaproteobacteria bacterium]
MKRFVLGALAALGSVGLYKLHKDGKLQIPVLKVKGTVDSVDYETRTFQLRSALDRNILMEMAVAPTTKFMWLTTAEGAENTAQFADITEGEKLNVAFSKNKESGRIIAERVVIENV